MELSINKLSIARAKKIRKKERARIKRDLIKKIKAHENSIAKELYKSHKFEEIGYNSFSNSRCSDNTRYLVLRFIGLKIDKSKKTGFIKNSESEINQYTNKSSYRLILTLK